jgi:gag-polypeptide of LTR copia-type
MMTSYAIWTRLQGIFESKGVVGIVNLCQDLFRTFPEDGANMEEHVRKLHGLQQELNARGQLVTNADFTNTLLTSLPDSWSHSSLL